MSYTENLRVEEKKNAEYVPDNVVNLSTFDNPYEPGVKVREALRGYNSTHLTSNPDASLKTLKQALAKENDVNPNQVEVMNGLGEALTLVAMACFNSDKPVMLPDVTCNAHVNAMKLLNIQTKQIQLNNEFKINVADITDNGGVLLKNPNAPTSIALSKDEIEAVLKQNPDVIVVVDEMYIGFPYASVVSLVKDYPNLVIIKTMKAYRALSGINVSYVIGSKEVVAAISGLKALFNPSSVSSLSNALALASLEDEEYVLKNARMVLKTKEYVLSELGKLGFTTLPSDTNFLVVKHKKTPANKIHDKLLKRGYKVSLLDGPLDGYLAFTVSTQDIMNAFLKELKHAA